MKRPTFDKSQEAYVKHLEETVSAFNSDDALVESYLALRSFISKISKVIKDADMTADMVEDKDDKFMDRVMNFSKLLFDRNKDLKEMEGMISPIDIEKANEKESGGDLETLIDEI